ncbi:MAG: ACT domain-containing protein [Anaerolineae bacterium]|nr:ACT domain-containing protein [Anaerolineae bacterium]MCB0255542.1 ACT domain-containing protein [Anaerolineae bacterium]
MSATLQLTTLSFTFAVCRLDPASPVPSWSAAGRLFAVVRTDEELSIVCQQELVPAGVVCERDWRALKVAGPLDFALTGILARLAGPLADAGIPIFAISTYDTDYLLVKSDQLAAAVETLHAAGCTVL